MPAGMTEKTIAMCEKFGLPTTHQPWNVDELYVALTHDKKHVARPSNSSSSPIGTGDHPSNSNGRNARISTSIVF